MQMHMPKVQVKLRVISKDDEWKDDDVSDRFMVAAMKLKQVRG